MITMNIKIIENKKIIKTIKTIKINGLRPIVATLALSLFLVSCGSHKLRGHAQANSKGGFLNQTDKTDKEEKNQGKYEEETNTKVGRSAIIGSAEIKGNENFSGKTYYLENADHLELENYYFDIPVVYNDSVKKWIDYFLNRGREYFENYSARAGRYAPLMGKLLEENGLPRDLIFLAMAESGFQNTAKSWALAVGPWQFMPYTGKRYGLKIDWYVDERRDPIKATIAAASYLNKLYGDFGAWELAAAAYNAGEGKVSRAIRKYNSENFWDLRQGRYLKSETKNYVPKIMALAIIGKNLKTFGLDNIDFHEPLDFDEIEVPKYTDLELLSAALGVEFEEIQRLNPELMRWFTPPNMETYTLRVPTGIKKTWQECCEGRIFTATNFQRYKVGHKKGQKVSEIAKKFKVKPYVLEDLNGLDAHKRLAKGQEILLPFRDNHSVRDGMYADLYDLPRRSPRRKDYRGRRKAARSKLGKQEVLKGYYIVQKGDTLWDVARKTGTRLNSLINSNASIVNTRGIRAGDKLVVR